MQLNDGEDLEDKPGKKASKASKGKGGKGDAGARGSTRVERAEFDDEDLLGEVEGVEVAQQEGKKKNKGKAGKKNGVLSNDFVDAADIGDGCDHCVLWRIVVSVYVGI